MGSGMKNSIECPRVGLPTYYVQIYTYGLSLTVFGIFRWLQNSFLANVRPPETDTMTNTDVEVTASSRRNK